MTSSLLLHTTPLDSISHRQAGGKGWNLFRLKAGQFPVPPWLIIGSTMFDTLVAPHRETIATLLQGLDCTDSAAIKEISVQIGSRIMGLAFPRLAQQWA